MKETNQVLSAESGSAFNEGIGLVLSRWSALRSAVDNEWGGRNSRQKADQIHSDIYSWFTLSTEALYIDDLEDRLYEGLLSLNTEVEDGSVEEVAEKLMIMHEECLEGNYNSVEGLRESSHKRVAVSCVRKENESDSDDDEDDDDQDMDEGPGSAGHVGSPRTTVGSSSSASNPNPEEMQIDNRDPSSESNPNPVDVQMDRPSPQPSANEDGWVVVEPRRGRGKKKVG